jgi:hypothetical protein
LAKPNARFHVEAVQGLVFSHVLFRLLKFGGIPDDRTILDRHAPCIDNRHTLQGSGKGGLGEASTADHVTARRHRLASNEGEPENPHKFLALQT